MFLSLLLAVSLTQSTPGQAVTNRPAMSVAYDFNMEEIAAALGVTCEYCHGSRQDGPQPMTTSGKGRLDVGVEMMVMTLALNQTLAEATGKPANEVTRVECVTCHRGVPIPRQIEDILWQTAMTNGAEAAVKQYRELRSQFHGRAAYDFAEKPVLLVADRLATAKPDIALALVAMNLEFFPPSADSLLIRSRAQVRQRDFAGAIESLRQALEIEPNNALVKSRLYQLEQQ